VEATFAFVDLAGFSALTEVHGDEQAADLLDRFEHISRDALGADDRLVKMIGDAAMIRFVSPRGAITGVKRLIDACMAEPAFPIPRAGLHHGAAIERSGDFVGHAVNVAARVAGQASGGQTLATTFVATAARAMNLRVIELGCFELRNLSAPVELFEIELHAATDGTVIDPVCRMKVARSWAAGHLRHGEVEYLFCSLSCAALFAADPEHYAQGDSGI
jgi:adenylate cyclase